MPPAAIVEHELPRRLRLRIPTRRGDQSFFRQIAQALAGSPGIQSVSVNPQTASILIHHQAATADITAFASDHDLFELTSKIPAPAPLKREIATSRRAPAPLSAVAVGFSGAAVYQIARGRYFGNAAESFWTSYTASTILKNPWLATALFGVGLVQLTRGPLLGSATSMLFYAASARHLSRRRPPRAADRGRPPVS